MGQKLKFEVSARQATEAKAKLCTREQEILESHSELEISRASEGATSCGHHEPQRFLSILASGVGVGVLTLEPVGSRSSFSGEGEGSEVNGIPYSISRAAAV